MMYVITLFNCFSSQRKPGDIHASQISCPVSLTLSALPRTVVHQDRISRMELSDLFRFLPMASSMMLDSFEMESYGLVASLVFFFSRLARHNAFSCHENICPAYIIDYIIFTNLSQNYTTLL